MAGERALQSSRQTATATILATAGMFWGVCLVAGADEASVVIRDNGASGTIIFEAEQAANGRSVQSPPGPLVCGTDIHATLAGTSVVAYVYYTAIK